MGVAPIDYRFADGSVHWLGRAWIQSGEPSRICPDPSSITARGASYYTIGSIKNDPPTGVAPVWSALRERCIAASATEE